MKIWSLYIIQLVPWERARLNGMTPGLYWIVITPCSIYLLSIDLSFSEINVAPRNSGIPVMLSYAPPYFGCDIIISFFAVCKIIIGEVQLRSFIGNFQERQIYIYICNVSESAVPCPLLIYCYMYKHASFTCWAPPCSVLFSKTVWAFGGWPSFRIYCYNSATISVGALQRR